MVEMNNKWPSDQDALELMKLLFIIKVSKGLLDSKKIYSKPLQNGSLDVHLHGFVFRCHLVIDKELSNLIKLNNVTELREIGKKSKKRNVGSKNELNTKPILSFPKQVRQWVYKNKFIPEIDNQISVFSSQFGGVYSDTCRIVKRWLGAHLIDIIGDDDDRIYQSYLKTNENKTNLIGYCMTEIAVELIVAHLFISPDERYIRAPE